MTDKAVLFASFVFAIVLLSFVLAIWRLRTRATQKAEAERRMGAALEELNKLTSKLRAAQTLRDGKTATSGAKESGGLQESGIGDSVSGRKDE